MCDCGCTAAEETTVEATVDTSVSFDTNQDGIIDQVGRDTTGEGVVDTWDIDNNQDGVIDQVAVDTVGDGVAHEWRIDANQDGVTDEVQTDQPAVDVVTIGGPGTLPGVGDITIVPPDAPQPPPSSDTFTIGGPGTLPGVGDITIVEPPQQPQMQTDTTHTIPGYDLTPGPQTEWDRQMDELEQSIINRTPQTPDPNDPNAVANQMLIDNFNRDALANIQANQDASNSMFTAPQGITREVNSSNQVVNRDNSGDTSTSLSGRYDEDGNFNLD